ncbi:MAG: hypothetical protein QOD33_541 [Pyrinomonadaceae bacterium]|jgi:hypothetical protein|nr:hypothetical protein [Pyrinomonadaceae bacterium]
MLKQDDLMSPEASATLEQRRAFLKLPLLERRRILAAQAEAAAADYESRLTVSEREAWQGGDIVEY